MSNLGWSDAPIIEEYESDSEDECVSIPTKQQETPSFANQQVKTPRENVKSQFTHSQKPKVDKKDLGHGFTVRACFVCGSLNHLIRDCDFHEKRMARKAELNNGWNNVQRVNKQNQFVPSAVLTRTGIIPVNTARTSGTKNFSTARQSVNRQTVLTSTAMKVNTVKALIVKEFRTRKFVFHSKLMSHLQVSTDSAKLVPLGKVCTALETLKKNTAKGTNTMVVLDSCPKHNMDCRILGKSDGECRVSLGFLDFLNAKFRHHAPHSSRGAFGRLPNSRGKRRGWLAATTAGLAVGTAGLVVETRRFWTSAKSKTINNVRHITAKVAGKSVSISEASIRSDLLFDDADGIDTLPNQVIFDSIQLMGNTGENLGGIHPVDKSLSGKILKVQITKLKKQAKPVIKHHTTYLKSVSLKQRFLRKSFLKKHRGTKDVCIQTREEVVSLLKGEISVQRDPLFDEIPEDTVDHMETENAQNEGRTREMVDEDKEIDENILSLEAPCFLQNRKVSDEQDEGTKSTMKVWKAHMKVTKEQNWKVLMKHYWKLTEEKNEGRKSNIEIRLKEKAANEALIRNFDDIKARIEADRLLAEKLPRARKRAIYNRRKSNEESKEEVQKESKDRASYQKEEIGSVAVYQLVMDRFQDEIPEGLVYSICFVEKKYPLRKEVLMQMLKLKLESEEDSTMALELIKLIKKILAELEPEAKD
ncbi:hypothetical protein Tco_0444945 [Tanacetum coccineum]